MFTQIFTVSTRRKKKQDQENPFPIVVAKTVKLLAKNFSGYQNMSGSSGTVTKVPYRSQDFFDVNKFMELEIDTNSLNPALAA